jgi:hypothetical protein
MRRLAAMLLIVPASAGAAPVPAHQPDIVVTGENRIVCRHVRRTATRMRVGRLCRRLSEWQSDSDAAIRDGVDPNATIDGAADTLGVLGQRSAVRSEGALGPR